MVSRKQKGFSLLELTIALSISMILCAVTIFALQPVFKQQHVNDAYNTTLMALRKAHDAAAADMRIYLVTFTAANPGINGGTITVTQDIPTAPVLFTATLPPDVTFHVETGVPTSSTVAPTTPDGFGSAASAFDFDQPPSGAGGSALIYFYPDGTAQDAGPNGGDINNGVVYFGIAGQLPTQRAVSLWGYTGRVRGWTLIQVAGVWTWKQM
jgi:prepilin-type N-terminal cleavage/methylation domain-containing protein